MRNNWSVEIAEIIRDIIVDDITDVKIVQAGYFPRLADILARDTNDKELRNLLPSCEVFCELSDNKLSGIGNCGEDQVYDISIICHCRYDSTNADAWSDTMEFASRVSDIFINNRKLPDSSGVIFTGSDNTIEIDYILLRSGPAFMPPKNDSQKICLYEIKGNAYIKYSPGATPVEESE